VGGMKNSRGLWVVSCGLGIVGQNRCGFNRDLVMKQTFRIRPLMLYLGAFIFTCNFLQLCCVKATPPQSIDNISSNKPIGFDMAVSNGQTINLVWTDDQTIIGQTQSLRYQKSHDAGNSWSKPIRLITTSGDKSIVNPRIYATGDTILVFWLYNDLYLQLSTDGGITWGKTVTSISDSNILKGNIGKYSIVFNSGVLYVVYSDYVWDGKSATYFTKSSDLGKSWKKPVQIAPYIKETNSQDPISIDIVEKNIHAVVQLIERHPGLSISKVYRAYSDDLGENWYPTINLDMSEWEKETNASVPTNNFRIVSQEKGLLIFFQKEYYWFYIISTNNGDTWSNPEMLAKEPIMQYSLYKSPSGAINIVWIDRRNQNRDWWSDIPLSQILTLGADPEWDNNDLYYATFEKGGIKNIERLTPQLSFVEPYISTGVNTIACENIGNRLAIFWAGKKKIGKSSIDSPEPYKIYFRKLGSIGN
jgi:hypothetical protein